MYTITTVQVLALLIIGLFITDNVLRGIYEGFGIKFEGNVWVNWFGVSYLLYFTYTIIRGLLINKKSNYLKTRMTSILFWLLFISSIYAVFVPFVKGENPF